MFFSQYLLPHNNGGTTIQIPLNLFTRMIGSGQGVATILDVHP